MTKRLGILDDGCGERVKPSPLGAAYLAFPSVTARLEAETSILVLMNGQPGVILKWGAYANLLQKRGELKKMD